LKKKKNENRKPVKKKHVDFYSPHLLFLIITSHVLHSENNQKTKTRHGYTNLSQEKKKER